MVRVVFLHPDLGIGGAERLVVDAALALKSKGHRVSFFTSHHDKKHSFEETKDGTFSITVVGDWIPRHVFGRFHALFAYLRMMFVALYLVTVSRTKPDIVFCDQISACIPIIKILGRMKVVFYCHFPDQLLTGRDTTLKSLYRKPIDWLEEKTTGMADFLLVNSHFTSDIFRSTFKSLKSLETHVLHPSLNTEAFDKQKKELGTDRKTKDLLPPGCNCLFLSINRFERKKNLPLAIHAMAELKEMVSDDEWSSVHLAMAGGYDKIVKENVEHFSELDDLKKQLHLEGKISFFKSISSDRKLNLFKLATATIYTPPNEHFGIVPVESMYMEKPVIALNSGGPLETIEDGVTGFLCNDDPHTIAEAMLKFVRDKKLSRTMGLAGKERVEKHFSFETFATSLNGIVLSILD